MRASDQRILTTHMDSLPRPPVLRDLLVRQDRGEAVDAPQLEREVEAAARAAVAGQLEAGIDVGTDGEQARPGFATCVTRRLRGFGGESRRPPARDLVDFPDYAALLAARRVLGRPHRRRPAGGGRGRLRRPGRGRPRMRPPAPAHGRPPAEVRRALPDRGRPGHHRHHPPERPLRLPRALRLRARSREAPGVRADPRPGVAPAARLPGPGHGAGAALPARAAGPVPLQIVETHVEAINRATASIPPDRIRLHVCWGNYDARTRTTSPWSRSSPCSTGPGWARCRSSWRTPGTSTSTG